MKRHFLFIAGLLFSMQVMAQTGIGTTTPNASAKLDVYSDNKGFLPPRVTLTSATDNTTVPNAAEGLLVYNKGSVGLQAGYYYWNGANWATIASATSAGNGVSASEMVKIYDSVTHSTASIRNNGKFFSVATSGRYLIDFTCGGTNMPGGTLTMNFTIRDGTIVKGSDMQTSYNNNVHVEYNGKVEMNLQAGVVYNAYVYTTSGSIENNDYCRIYMKQVSGNLPVTGQSVEYGLARYTGADGSAIADNAIVPFDATASGNLTWSSNKFTLKANKTYELESSLAIFITGSTAGVAGRFQIYDYTNSVALANGLFMSQNGSGTNAQSANSPMKGIITPVTDIQVGIRLLDHYGPNGPSIAGNGSITGSQSATNASYFMVKQIGSSAIVNPWTLAGTNTYNTTGNVGIGTNAPAATLDVTGSLTASGATTFKDIVKIGTGIGDEGGEFQFAIPATNTSLQNRVNVDVWQNRLRFFEGSNNAKGVYIDLNKAPNGVGGEISYKASGIVNAGTFVQLDNLKATLPTSGNRSLSIASVSGSFVAWINGTYTLFGGGVSGTGATFTVTTTPTLAINWNFVGAGDTINYTIVDTTNGRAYRIILMIGPGYDNNFISIERIH